MIENQSAIKNLSPGPPVPFLPSETKSKETVKKSVTFNEKQRIIRANLNTEKPLKGEFFRKRTLLETIEYLIGLSALIMEPESSSPNIQLKSDDKEESNFEFSSRLLELFKSTLKNLEEKLKKAKLARDDIKISNLACLLDIFFNKIDSLEIQIPSLEEKRSLSTSNHFQTNETNSTEDCINLRFKGIFKYCRKLRLHYFIGQSLSTASTYSYFQEGFQCAQITSKAVGLIYCQLRMMYEDVMPDSSDSRLAVARGFFISSTQNPSLENLPLGFQRLALLISCIGEAWLTNRITKSKLEGQSLERLKNFLGEEVQPTLLASSYEIQMDEFNNREACEVAMVKLIEKFEGSESKSKNFRSKTAQDIQASWWSKKEVAVDEQNDNGFANICRMLICGHQMLGIVYRLVSKINKENGTVDPKYLSFCVDSLSSLLLTVKDIVVEYSRERQNSK